MASKTPTHSLLELIVSPLAADVYWQAFNDVAVPTINVLCEHLEAAYVKLNLDYSKSMPGKLARWSGIMFLPPILHACFSDYAPFVTIRP